MSGFFKLLGFDIRLHCRRGGEWAALVLFFLIIILLLPFAIGPEPDLLRRLAPGLIWLAALLMTLLAIEKLFLADAQDGTLDLMRLSPLPLPVIVVSRLLAHIIFMLTALAIMIVPASLMLGLDFGMVPSLLLSFALGVPVLVLLGGVIAAVTVTLPRNPALLTLLLVPFYIPVLIFADGACEAAISGAPGLPNFLLLGALLALLLPTAPFIIASALRNAEG